jgi:hypothetical protein
MHACLSTVGVAAGLETVDAADFPRLGELAPWAQRHVEVWAFDEVVAGDVVECWLEVENDEEVPRWLICTKKSPSECSKDKQRRSPT